MTTYKTKDELLKAREQRKNARKYHGTREYNYYSDKYGNKTIVKRFLHTDPFWN